MSLAEWWELIAHWQPVLCELVRKYNGTGGKNYTLALASRNASQMGLVLERTYLNMARDNPDGEHGGETLELLVENRVAVQDEEAEYFREIQEVKDQRKGES